MMAQLSNAVIEQLMMQLNSVQLRLEEEKAQLARQKEDRAGEVARLTELVKAQETVVNGVRLEGDGLREAIKILRDSLGILPPADDSEAPPTPEAPTEEAPPIEEETK